MKDISQMLIKDLRNTLSSLNTSEGSMSASLYETARALCFRPNNIHETLDWIISRQKNDGGWGLPACEISRDVPTLAAILALHRFGAAEKTKTAAQAGLEYLGKSAGKWLANEEPPNGAELFIPGMVKDAKEAGLSIPHEQYAALIEMGGNRIELIRTYFHPEKTKAIAASWEDWGITADPALVDSAGSVGHSPATTAAWLKMAGDNPALAEQAAAAVNYLTRSAGATGVGIPEVLPAAFPSYRFEQSFSLWALLAAGLLKAPELEDVVTPLAKNLVPAIQASGIGASDSFQPDGDDTGAALGVARALGFQVDVSILRQFEKGDHFCAWSFEMQSALSVSARALCTLSAFGEAAPLSLEKIISEQLPNGRWEGDKWQSSWIYTTMHCVLALSEWNKLEAAEKGAVALIKNQQKDGGWGMDNSTPIETAFALIALQDMGRKGFQSTAFKQSREQALTFLLDKYSSEAFTDMLWLAKDEYSPQNIDRVFILAAILAEQML
ncbi:MAG: hypothetical protein GY754_07860 [bacterium]|nr:hypothetical protein [bacterium]